MKKIVLLFVLFGLFVQVNAQRNYTAKKLLFSQVQKPYINYGYLYNGYVLRNTSSVAAAGWHVASESEWDALISYLGGLSVAGGKLKQIGFTYWDSTNTGASNDVYFNIKGAGYRGQAEGFFNVRQRCYFYSSTASSASRHAGYLFQYTTANIIKFTGEFTALNDYGGYSLRIIKDSTTLTDGQSGTYIGNDGKVYRTIAIGNPAQEWLADNLAETKFRDGSIIPFAGANGINFTDSEWNSLWLNQLPGRCVYNNDESYR